mgnify:CR=1 FL=1
MYHPCRYRLLQDKRDTLPRRVLRQIHDQHIDEVFFLKQVTLTVIKARERTQQRVCELLDLAMRRSEKMIKSLPIRTFRTTEQVSLPELYLDCLLWIGALLKPPGKRLKSRTNFDPVLRIHKEALNLFVVKLFRIIWRRLLPVCRIELHIQI